MKAVEERLRLTLDDYPNEFKRNLRYHVATAYVVTALGSVSYKSTDLKPIADGPIDDGLLDEVIDRVMQAYFEFEEARETWSVDKIVKNKEFVEALLEAIEEDLKSSAEEAATSDGSSEQTPNA